MHFNAGQFRQNIGHVFQSGPIQLQILPCGEMAIAFVISAGNVGQLAHLFARQRAIGNGNAQHIGMQLQIEAIHQAMNAELILIQFAR